jgi:S1-C subfamily serine protease
MMFKKILTILCLTATMSAMSHAAKLSELLPNEKNTVEVFQNASPKVVYVHRMTTVVKRTSERLDVPAGTGSGIIWDAQGHVVTNFHVVHGADHLSISIGDITVPAKVIGTEPRKDIAVLAITSPKALKMLKAYKPFEIADTHELLVGQKAIAIGNPFGLDHTLTVGVISALGRQVPGIGGIKIREMIQTDASINPGNSGGPLLDSAGRLIGLNTAIFSPSGSSAGIGFSVPANDIARIVQQIITKGRVVLAGIGVQRADPRITQRLGIKKGVLIAGVLPHTPAAYAGLQATHRDSLGRTVPGDILISLNGHSLENYDVLYNLLTEVKVGEKVTVTVLRNGKPIHYAMKTIDIAGYKSS